MYVFVVSSLRDIQLSSQQVTPTSIIIAIGCNIGGSVVTMGVIWIALGSDISSRQTNQPCSSNNS
jgi:hypothetical protein